MAISTAYSRTEAVEMLELWKAAEKALASGQAKSYKIGTREFTAVDLPDIAARIEYFKNMIDAIDGSVKTSRVVRVIPRDL